MGFSHKPHHRNPATDTARVMLISFTLVKSEGAGKARRRLTPAARLRKKCRRQSPQVWPNNRRIQLVVATLDEEVAMGIRKKRST
ncbi:hypothetical protein, partial [Bradyrhizobium sp. SZCCHNS30582]|uniref:hypothetical protein n=1 Tax=Bradyrhizobium sp. SZCCHNS30582 TaxID=3057327 RepID=UPI002915FC66